MSGEMPAIPELKFGMVDVKDSALAHVRAVTEPGAANGRFLLVEDSYWFREVAGWLHAKYASDGYKVSNKPMGTFLLRCFACCSAQAEATLAEWGVDYTFDTTATV